jgi:DNA ligase D-like protein (predicted ligase)
MESILKSLPRNLQKISVKKAQPDWINPMLATLTERRFSDKDWIFEKKLDGVRAIAYRNNNEIRLLSRNKLSFNTSYANVVERLRSQTSRSFIIDGEIVALEKGESSFSKLQQRMKLRGSNRPMAIYYFVFDLLYLDGYDLQELPLIERKKILRKAIDFDQRIRFTPHRVAEGEAYYEEACRLGWEGLIAKRAESVYVSGRSPEWLKFKCSKQQEFVIVGYTDPQGARTGFGALLVGFYSGSNLMYAGKVGTGFNTETLRTLTKKLKSIEVSTPIVKGKGLPRKNAHWVKPELVAQIAFTEWTSDNKLRHPRFLGLRQDKSPREVIQEKATV